MRDEISRSRYLLLSYGLKMNDTSKYIETITENLFKLVKVYYLPLKNRFKKQ